MVPDTEVFFLPPAIQRLTKAREPYHFYEDDGVNVIGCKTYKYEIT